MRILSILLVATIMMACDNDTQTISDKDEVVDAIDSEILVDSLSGLVMAEHFEIVRAQCTACHSAKLITQSSASREGWEQMIRWMQKGQGLQDLGENEDLILDYLSLHYGVKKKGRRTPLTNIEWYVLEPEP